MGIAMILAGGTLAAYLSTCAPTIAPTTMAAIVGVESGGSPFALHDNTTRRAYAPRDARLALVIARALLARGDSVDIGIAQVNSENFAAYHVDASDMLQPCSNLSVASRILDNAYTRAAATFPAPREALWHAISAYNTGSLFAGHAYVAAVVAEAMRPATAPPIAILATPAMALPPISPRVSTGTLTVPHRRMRAAARLAPTRPPAPFGPLHAAGITHTLSIAIGHASS